MSRFRPHKEVKKKVPVLNTAALPDLIFTLLFFFMLVTHMRPVPVLTDYTVPEASEIRKLEKQGQTIYIMVGKSKTNPDTDIIQVNSMIVSLEELTGALQQIKDEKPETLPSEYVIILKVDKKAPIGIVNDIRHLLRSENLLKVYYSTERSFNL